jgi:hypothetical protein
MGIEGTNRSFTLGDFSDEHPVAVLVLVRCHKLCPAHRVDEHPIVVLYLTVKK